MRTQTYRRALLPVLGACCAAMIALSTFTSCGIFTAVVSVPEAFSHNNDLGLRGTITDDRGAPLDAVQMTVKREYYLWHATASYPEFDTSTLTENHAFTIPSRRAHELTFTFHLNGYRDQTTVVSQHAIVADYQWTEGSTWPLDTPVRVMLQKADRQAAPLRWLAVDVDWTDPEKTPVIDLARLLLTSADPGLGFSREHTMDLSRDAVRTFRPGDPGSPIPPGCLTAAIERQPTPMTGPDHHFDPLDLNLPARLTLQISGAETSDGFVRTTAQAGCSPLAQMLEAPESGYAPALDFSAQRLRQMRNAADPLVPNRNEFFYIHARGLYGKGLINWNRNALADPAGPLRLTIILVFQPDGSRNLPLRNSL